MSLRAVGTTTLRLGPSLQASDIFLAPLAVPGLVDLDVAPLVSDASTAVTADLGRDLLGVEEEVVGGGGLIVFEDMAVWGRRVAKDT